MKKEYKTILQTKGFSISCKNKKCIGGKIDILLGRDEGYSNWTVMKNGYFSLKCHGCGKFGTTNKSVLPNELYNFDVVCLECEQKNKFNFYPGDIDGEIRPHLICTNCGQTFANIVKKYD